MLLNNKKYFKGIITLFILTVVVNAFCVTVFGSFTDFIFEKSADTIEQTGMTSQNEVEYSGGGNNFHSDRIEGVTSIPWVSALFITNYSPLTDYLKSDFESLYNFYSKAGFDDFCRGHDSRISSLTFNEYKLNQEMLIHISRLTAG